MELTLFALAVSATTPPPAFRLSATVSSAGGSDHARAISRRFGQEAASGQVSRIGAQNRRAQQ